MRDRFERWARQRCLDLTRCSQDADEYWSATTHIAWAAWQEATKPLVDQIARARAAIEAIVITEGEDAGVIVKNHESPTTWSDEHQCFVYQHEFFSELGDALIDLWKQTELRNEP